MRITAIIFIVISAVGFSVVAVGSLYRLFHRSKRIFLQTILFFLTTVCFYSTPALKLVESGNLKAWIFHELGWIYPVGIFMIIGIGASLINKSYYQGKHDAKSPPENMLA